MMKKALLACAVLLAGMQAAQTQQQSVCSRDASRLCRRVINDGDMAVLQCLKANRAKVTPACGALIDQH